VVYYGESQAAKVPKAGFSCISQSALYSSGHIANEKSGLDRNSGRFDPVLEEDRADPNEF